jgi:hypothetical protein
MLRVYFADKGAPGVKDPIDRSETTASRSAPAERVASTGDR